MDGRRVVSRFWEKSVGRAFPSSRHCTPFTTQDPNHAHGRAPAPVAQPTTARNVMRRSELAYIHEKATRRAQRAQHSELTDVWLSGGSVVSLVRAATARKAVPRSESACAAVSSLTCGRAEHRARLFKVMQLGRAFPRSRRCTPLVIQDPHYAHRHGKRQQLKPRWRGRRCDECIS